MAGTFSEASPGQETVRYGDYIYVTAGEDLYAGEAVTIDASGNAVRVASAGTDEVAGVAYINADSGNEVTIKTNGSVVARVFDDGALSAGVTYGDNAGTTANNAGELSPDGDSYVALEVCSKEDPRAGDGTAVSYAEVSKR